MAHETSYGRLPGETGRMSPTFPVLCIGALKPPQQEPYAAWHHNYRVAPCPICQRIVRVRADGNLSRHGPRKQVGT